MYPSDATTHNIYSEELRTDVLKRGGKPSRLVGKKLLKFLEEGASR